VGPHRDGTFGGTLWRAVTLLVVILAAVLAGDRAYGAEGEPVEEPAVIGEPLVLHAGEVVLGPATVIKASDVTPAALAPAPAGGAAVAVEVQVLSAGFERAAELPHTGVRTSMLAGVGSALVALGLVLVGLGGVPGQRAASNATAGR